MSNDVVRKKRFATLSLWVVLALIFFMVGWAVGAMSPLLYILVIGALVLTAVVILRLGIWAALLVLAIHLYLDWYRGDVIASITLDWLFLGIILVSPFIRANSTNMATAMPAASKAHTGHDELLDVSERVHHRDHELSDETDGKELAVEEAAPKKMPETPKPRQFLSPTWLAPLTPNGRRLLKSPFPFGDPGNGRDEIGRGDL